MDLLPSSHAEFSSSKYWDSFFKKRGQAAFEWYGEYPELSQVLHKYIKPVDKVLVVGCGNSRLSEQLYDIGYYNIINIDISDIVIKQMKSRNAEKRPKMVYQNMDMLNMEYTDSEFNVVLDKGTLDALMTDDTPDVQEQVNKMFAEINRILKIGGRYICISLAQGHILQKLLTYFPDEGWMVRVHKVEQNISSDTTKRDFQLPTFAFVCTKFKSVPQMENKLLEVCMDDSGKLNRVKTTLDVMKAVEEQQHYAMIRQSLVNKSHIDEDISLDLCVSSSDIPRYTLHIVDNLHARRHHQIFAVFIVPQGRETEWLFGDREGRKQLADSAGFKRLIVVLLHREHKYDNMDSIKSELSSKVMELSPTGMDRQLQVPFLSVGQDIGQRTIKYEGHSALSGKFVVEDVEGDNKQILRRLVFYSNKNIVQSESRLIQEIKRKAKSRKKKTLVVVDHSYLACQHHVAMVSGISLYQCFTSSISVDVVELDSAIVEVATKWFGFVEDERMKIYVGDGLKFIENKALQGSENVYDIIMFDIDSKDKTRGISSPPTEFIQKDFLEKVAKILHDNGLFILNLVCRDKELKKSILDDLKIIFPRIYCNKIEDEVNEIIYISKQGDIEKHEMSKIVQQSKDNAKHLETVARQHTDTWDSDVDLASQLDNLEIF
uniref:Methyltransferase-like protein 13-like n=1 Tax=Saccoglossus kowalevskii TaxID=10224 RepID=A0ABM0GM19_SACKO|nr:PREDICTED: methyltransferase-like protein 13-like [Saccoglossus kowalevskii]